MTSRPSFANRVGFLVAAAVWLIATPARAQIIRDIPMAPTGTAVIAGTVAESGAQAQPSPVRRVLVTLTGTGGVARALSDDAGRFVFSGLAAGRYTLTAEKPAYLKTFYGSPRPARGPGTPIPLANAQRLSDLRVTLVRGAVIEGTLRDANGTPLWGGQVRAMQVVYENGERKIVDLPPPRQLATTDDQGMYRLYGLPAGEYTVSAASGGGLGHVITAAEIDQAASALRGPRTAIPSTAKPPAPAPEPQLSRGASLYPGVTNPADAQTFKLEAGEERTGVDIVSRLRPVFVISGVALTSDGQPATGASIGVQGMTYNAGSFSPGILRPGADGRFTMPAVEPGRYLFYGRDASQEVTSGTSWISQELLHENGPSEIVLQFRRGVAVSGRVVAPAGASLNQANVQVLLRAVTMFPDSSPELPGSRLDATGTFRFVSIPAGKYRLTLSGIGALSPHSAITGGRDILDTPLELTSDAPVTDIVVTLTDRPSEISGTLFDQLGRPAPEYAVVAFPVNPALRTQAHRVDRVASCALGTDGKYVITGLPAGEYYLAAVTDLDPLQLNDPGFLELMSPAAIRITLGEGERRVQDLKIGL